MIDAAWRVTETVPSDERMGVLLSSARTSHAVKMLKRWRAMVAAAPEAPEGRQNLADAP